MLADTSRPMKTPPRSQFARTILLAVALALAGPVCAQNVVPLDQQDMANAEKLYEAGKYAEALKLYQGIPQKYPTSALIPGSNLGEAICFFFLKDYDKAAKSAEENLKLKTPPVADILERTYLLIPQIYLTKGVSMDLKDPLRARTFQDAIKAFDALLAKFPNGEEAESALYGKGRAQLILEQYEAAAEAFRANLTKFPQSPSILDSQFLLAISLYLKAGKAMNNTGTADQTIAPTLSESEKLLSDIVSKRSDLALVNRSNFQLGDVLIARASITKKETGEQEKVQKAALNAYRTVAPKDVVIAVQEQRIKFFDDLRIKAGQEAKLQEFRRYQRLVEKEREKLETIKSEADQSVAAKIKSGQLFVALGKFDEARVLLKFADGFIADDEEGKLQKKQTLYLTAITYAAQHVAEKSVELFDKFKAEHKNDPIAENLDLLMGGVFLDPDPKINNPDKAIKYFDQQVAEYPASKFSAEAVMQKATALIQLARYDEAVASLQGFISSSKDPVLLASAEYNLAIAYMKMSKFDEASKAFKTVRDKYPTSEQAEEAGFWSGQILFTKGDQKAALAEFDAFLQKSPNSELVPQALYFKAKALLGLGKKPEGLAVFKKIGDEYPQSEVAIPQFFERAKVLQEEGKLAEADAVMRDFLKQFPDAGQVYSAFDYIAQISIAQKKPQEAIKVYEEFIANYGSDVAAAKAHVAIANLWKKEAEGIGPYLAISAADQKRWNEGMDSAIKNAESAIRKFPEGDAVSPALQVLLGIQQLRQVINLIKPDDVKAYFIKLATEFEGKSTKSKILFAVAGFVAPKDPKSAFDMMKGSYADKLVYAPEDLDLFGNLLIEYKQPDEAQKVFEKLAGDYPIPANTQPDKVGRTVGTAQSVVLAGKARILQVKGQAAEGQKLLEDLKKLYPWSSKVAEADFGIAAGLFESKKFEEAVDILAKVAKMNTAPVPLRAKSMLMLAKSLQELKTYDDAINNYIKIGTFFEAEKEIAAEGLWLGAQLLEKQSTGEIPMPVKKAAPPATPKPGAAPSKPGAASPKPAAGQPAPKKA